MKKKQAAGIYRTVVAAALTLSTHMVIAQSVPSIVVTDAHARGLTVLGADVEPSANGYTVSARVSRSVMNGVLAPVALKVVVRDVAGAVKAEQVRELGPAEVPRRRTRSYRFDSQLSTTPAAGDTIEVKLGV